MLPTNTASVLQFLFPNSIPSKDWEVSHIPAKAGVREAVITISKWANDNPQPSEELINETAASPAFAVWLSERTDPELIKKRVAKELCDDNSDPFNVRDWAIHKEYLAYLTYLANAINQGRSEPDKIQVPYSFEQLKEVIKARIDVD